MGVPVGIDGETADSPPVDIETIVPAFGTGDDITMEEAPEVINPALKDTPPARAAKSRPPVVDEWADFFGRIVLRLVCNWYISWAFRGIDDDLVSDRDLERCQLKPEERAKIAVPLAEFSSKSKFMSRHGRQIVAAGNSIDSVLIMGAWMSRVNHIARKYRQTNATPQQGTEVNNGNVVPIGSNEFFAGQNGGRINPQFPIINNNYGG